MQGISKNDKRIKINTKERSLHRIKIIQGHLRKIEEMLQTNQYCLNIVHQSRAVQKALKQMDLLIIENHLKTCVVEQIKNNKEEETTEELLKLYEYK